MLLMILTVVRNWYPRDIMAAGEEKKKRSAGYTLVTVVCIQVTVKILNMSQCIMY